MKDTVNFRKEIIYPVTQVISLRGQIKAERGGEKRGGECKRDFVQIPFFLHISEKKKTHLEIRQADPN